MTHAVTNVSMSGATMTLTIVPGVSSIVVRGDIVYVAGAFTLAGSLRRRNLAAIGARTRRVTDWDPSTDGSVNAMVTAGDTLYVGGLFANVGGQARSHIAALDLGTGRATDWNPGADNAVFALALDESEVYAGGWFRELGDQPRAHIGAIDASSGAILAWNPGADDDVNALAVDGGVVYAGGEFTSLGGLPRARLGSIDASSGSVTRWDPTANSDALAVDALFLDGETLYVGGVFRSVYGQTRRDAAAFDISTGALTPWDPGFTEETGAVRAFARDATSLYIGGSFRGIGPATRGSFVRLPQ